MVEKPNVKQDFGTIPSPKKLKEFFGGLIYHYVVELNYRLQQTKW
jgi:hypothetical protein